MDIHGNESCDEAKLIKVKSYKLFGLDIEYVQFSTRAKKIN